MKIFLYYPLTRGGFKPQFFGKNCPRIVLPNYAPKIRSMHEHEELKQAHF